MDDSNATIVDLLLEGGGYRISVSDGSGIGTGRSLWGSASIRHLATASSDFSVSVGGYGCDVVCCYTECPERRLPGLGREQVGAAGWFGDERDHGDGCAERLRGQFWFDVATGADVGWYGG
jgi:hypothetical protein